MFFSSFQPENILLKNDEKFPEIRLIDFGLSRRVDLPYSQYDIVGTPEYVGKYTDPSHQKRHRSYSYICLCEYKIGYFKANLLIDYFRRFAL